MDGYRSGGFTGSPARSVRGRVWVDKQLVISQAVFSFWVARFLIWPVSDGIEDLPGVIPLVLSSDSVSRGVEGGKCSAKKAFLQCHPREGIARDRGFGIFSLTNAYE